MINDLFCELLLAQLVKGEELPGQGDVLQEAAAGQLDPDDDLPVRNHHRDIPELDLEIFWQLLAASIGGVHGDEDTKLRIHVHHVPISEGELLLLVLLTAKYHCALLGAD